MGERVPDEYKKRNDFLLENEMEIATNTIANRFGINLQPFYAFYRKDIRDCKHSLI